ncbi:MAG: aminoacyl-tRNA hydrolase [Aestuariivita sp.]|nr:aminoacyl-tRNA hydrolase [Aestuariivita sp.]MCY4201496.1 aminoacyl-tRNA hydrolase [Aestuariivita sp.]
MQIFVGLGNPGAKYANNRHNIGFLAVDQIAADHHFAPWREKFASQVCDGYLNQKKILLIKPLSFMNNSGQPIGQAMRFFRSTAQNITVFHDELDLVPGKVRFKVAGGHAGHNGLRSIHQHIGDGYHRVRIGIGHPGHKDLVTRYVLADFTQQEKLWAKAVLQGISAGAPALADSDPATFLNLIARQRNLNSPNAPKSETAQR